MPSGKKIHDHNLKVVGAASKRFPRSSWGSVVEIKAFLGVQLRKGIARLPAHPEGFRPRTLNFAARLFETNTHLLLPLHMHLCAPPSIMTLSLLHSLVSGLIGEY